MKIISYPSPNYADRNAPIDMIILHYTDMKDAESALERLSDPMTKVSSHYLIAKNGSIYQLVDDTKKAYHAGVSFWGDRTSINDYSIGIELDNPGHQYGLAPFPSAQMEALVELIHSLQQRFPIPNKFILGHSDVAPLRKKDPGELFDWAYLAQHKIGIWPDFQAPTTKNANLPSIKKALTDIGYMMPPIENFSDVIKAFQRHFYPQHLTGALDPETIRRIFLTEQAFCK